MEISTIKQYITEAIKGEPLYKSRSLSQEAKEAKEKIQRQVDFFRLKTARVASWTTQKMITSL